MSDDNACDDDEFPDCIDCKASLRMDDHDGEWPSVGPICYECLDNRRERLTAENARLATEVERLTPRPMTLEEVAKVFNEHMIHDRDDWDTDGCDVFCRHGDDRIEAGDATLMAQGLERDAGPFVVQDPPKGEGGTC